MVLNKIENIFNLFLLGKITVECKTLETATMFIKYCDFKGLRWGSGRTVEDEGINYNIYSQTYYIYNVGIKGIQYGDYTHRIDRSCEHYILE